MHWLLGYVIPVLVLSGFLIRQQISTANIWNLLDNGEFVLFRNTVPHSTKGGMTYPANQCQTLLIYLHMR